VRRSTVVVGGGFFGLRIALHLREHLELDSVIVLERETAMMSRSSLINQARVHNGYHYPRSILTGYRSQVNFPRFAAEYRDAVVDSFTHHYAVARAYSKVSARQFALFCDRIGAPHEAPEPEVAALFNPRTVEQVFRVVEPAFDSMVIRELLAERVRQVGGIELHTGVEATSIEALADGRIAVHTSDGAVIADRVISAIYSRMNVLHRSSGLSPIPMQHEIAELCLVRMPQELETLGITVMDGPFFSAMPFPTRGLHSLSHVRYTPHYRWHDGSGRLPDDPHEVLHSARLASNFRVMQSDVARFVPVLAEVRHEDSLYEVKTVLSKSAHDDSRPILFRPDHGIRGYTCIMGGKLDNIYDVLEELNLLYAHR
jgi:glycine/D-amino acid oxidase-like deaminating enzyme